MFLAVLHLALLALFYFEYQKSNDPERGLMFVIWLPLDPIAVLLMWPLATLFHSDSDVLPFGLLAVAGTAQWFFIGYYLRRLRRRYLKHAEEQRAISNADVKSS
jgi:hypothetical protein